MGIHASVVASDVASVGNSFDAAKFHRHQLNTNHPARAAGEGFKGRLSLLLVDVESLSGAATLTIRLTSDAAGDVCIVGDVTATISLGITTATDGSCEFKLEVDYDSLEGTDDVYLFAKTDAGTVTLSNSKLTWRDE